VSDLSDLVRFAVGYKYLYISNKTLKVLSIIDKSGTNRIIKEITPLINDFKAWNESAVDGNLKNIKELKSYITAYLKGIDSNRALTINYLTKLANGDYGFNISVMRNKVRLLKKYTEKFTEYLDASKQNEIYTGIVRAETTARIKMEKIQKLINELSGQLGNTAVSLDNDIEALRLEAKNTFAYVVAKGLSKIGLNDNVLFEDDMVSLSDSKNEHEKVIEWPMVVAILALTALVVNSVEKIVDSYNSFNELCDKIITKEKQLIEIDPIYSVARQASRITAQLLDSFKVMDDTFVSLTNVFTSANDDRIACIDNLNNIIYKAGWNDPSKKKIYADLLKRFKNDEADMRNVLNVYNYIRAVGKERSIYIVL